MAKPTCAQKTLINGRNWISLADEGRTRKQVFLYAQGQGQGKTRISTHERMCVGLIHVVRQQLRPNR